MTLPRLSVDLIAFQNPRTPFRFNVKASGICYLKRTARPVVALAVQGSRRVVYACVVKGQVLESTVGACAGE